MNGPLSLHGKSLLLGLLLLGSLAAVLSQKPPSPAISLATLVIEHGSPSSLHAILTEKQGKGLLELGVESDEPTYVSVPLAWHITTTKHIDLAQTGALISGLEFHRLKMPGGSSVTYELRDVPQKLRFRNPSRLPLSLNVRFVNLDTKRSHGSSLLSTDPEIDIR